MCEKHKPETRVSERHKPGFRVWQNERVSPGPEFSKTRVSIPTWQPYSVTTVACSYVSVCIYNVGHSSVFFYLISNSQSSSWSIAWMRQWGVNNLPKVVEQQRHGRGSNPRPLARKSDAYRLATAPPFFFFFLMLMYKLQSTEDSSTSSHILTCWAAAGGFKCRCRLSVCVTKMHPYP